MSVVPQLPGKEMGNFLRVTQDWPNAVRWAPGRASSEWRSRVLRFESNPSRRAIIAGAASTAAAALLPVLPTPRPKPVEALWPTDTQAQRQAVIVRAIKAHIAEREGRPVGSVTVDDIHNSVRYFGMTREEVVEAEAEILRRLGATTADG